MDFKIINPSNGRSGGLILFWKREVQIDLLFSAPMYIDVKINEGPNKEWRFTCIYGEARWDDRYKTWDKLHELKSNSSLPWVILGDFNEILYSHEKEGGNPRPHGYMQGFRDDLTDCELEDLGFSGEAFTWKRGRLRERLDRSVAFGPWINMYPGAKLQHLGFVRSYHRLILLDTDYQEILNTGPRLKRFEAKWLRESQFRKVVQCAWDEAASVSEDGVLGRLSRMHDSLHAWDSQVLPKPKRCLRKAQRELEKAMNDPILDENETKAKEMADLIELLLEQDEVYWAQRSRANWLQFGDRNTSFFHNFASAHRKKNRITKLKNDDGD
jgi:hypothetical protein